MATKAVEGVERGTDNRNNHAPGLDKRVFTTGAIARRLHVAPRTVSKWFDSGRLKGYRIPGSLDRRVMRHDLIAFLKETGLPLGDLAEEEVAKVLLVDLDHKL